MTIHGSDNPNQHVASQASTQHVPFYQRTTQALRNIIRAIFESFRDASQPAPTNPETNLETKGNNNQRLTPAGGDWCRKTQHNKVLHIRRRKRPKRRPVKRHKQQDTHISGPPDRPRERSKEFNSPKTTTRNHLTSPISHRRVRKNKKALSRQPGTKGDVEDVSPLVSESRTDTTQSIRSASSTRILRTSRNSIRAPSRDVWRRPQICTVPWRTSPPQSILSTPLGRTSKDYDEVYEEGIEPQSTNSSLKSRTPNLSYLALTSLM